MNDQKNHVENLIERFNLMNILGIGVLVAYAVVLAGMFMQSWSPGRALFGIPWLLSALGVYAIVVALLAFYTRRLPIFLLSILLLIFVLDESELIQSTTGVRLSFLYTNWFALTISLGFMYVVLNWLFKKIRRMF